MSAIHSPHDSSLTSAGLSQRAGVFSSAATRAGRELVWLLIATAFCMVEAAIFVTDLPVTKLFDRRRR